MKLSIKDFLQQMRPNMRFPVDLGSFTEEILNGKLHFLCSMNYSARKIVIQKFKDKVHIRDHSVPNWIHDFICFHSKNTI